MRGFRSIGPAILLGALGACGQGGNANPPGEVTAGEARALDEAAEMIEQRRLPPEALASDDPALSPPTTPARP